MPYYIYVKSNTRKFRRYPILYFVNNMNFEE